MNGVYLFGPPGVGKTTLMDALLADVVRLPPERVGRLVLEPLLAGDGTFGGMHLGRTRAHHGGTDALPYDVVADACTWVRDTSVTTLYGEGARLANVRFAEACGPGMLWVYLDAPADVLDARCATRGTHQSVAWRKGATSAARNLHGTLVSSGSWVRQYAALDDPQVMARAIATDMATAPSSRGRGA